MILRFTLCREHKKRIAKAGSRGRSRRSPSRPARKKSSSRSTNFSSLPALTASGEEEKFIEIDEQPFKANLDKIATLKPAFRKDGTVTAANSSSISDGAAALVLMRRSTAERRGLAPLALIAGHATHAQEPGWFTTA